VILEGNEIQSYSLGQFRERNHISWPPDLRRDEGAEGKFVSVVCHGRFPSVSLCSTLVE
jgi:hypothetical protein